LEKLNLEVAERRANKVNCVESEPKKQPNMKQVVNLLKGQEHELVKAKYFRIRTKILVVELAYELLMLFFFLYLNI